MSTRQPTNQGNLELVSGKFTFYKDRRSQLWLVDAKVLWRGSGMVAVFVHSTCVRKFDVTLPETNIAPENGWLEYYIIFGIAYFQVLC